MAKLKEFEDISNDSIITTIRIAKKLEKEGKFFVHPFFGGATYGVKEAEPLIVDEEEQDSKTFSKNLGIIHHIAFHILSGTDDEIDKKINNDLIDVVRNKYIDEAFRDKFYVGSTSNSHLFIDIDYNFGKKFYLSEKAIDPPVPYLSVGFVLIDSSTGERKKIAMEMDCSTFDSLIKQLNEISEHAKKFRIGGS